MANYIKSLKTDNETWQMAADDADMAIMDLACYLTSKKFQCGNDLDGYVNIEDVKRYLVTIKDAQHGRDDDIIIN